MCRQWKIKYCLGLWNKSTDLNFKIFSNFNWQYCILTLTIHMSARPLTCYDCWFESRRRHWCLPILSVVCCQVEVSATGRSLIQGVLTSVGYLSVIAETQQWGDRVQLGLLSHGKNCISALYKHIFDRICCTCKLLYTHITAWWWPCTDRNIWEDHEWQMITTDCNLLDEIMHD
jgi:hypothetical protein